MTAVAAGVDDKLSLSGGTMSGNLSLQGAPFPLTIPAGAGAGMVLTSDSSGNASWQAPGTGLFPVAVQNSASSPYSAAHGSFVPVDATAGNVTVNLPAAPADGSIVAVKMIATASSHTVTIATGAGDVLNKTGGATSMTLSLLNQGAELQYRASLGVWYVTADDLALSQLDARYAATGALAAKTVVTVGFQAGCDFVCTGTHDGAQIAAAIAALPASGGKILIRNSATPYDFSAAADRIFLATSNVTLEGESYGGVVFKANAASINTGHIQWGLLTVGRLQTSLLSDITVRNIIINSNSETGSGGLCLDGSANLPGQLGLQNVLIENVLVTNLTGTTGQNSTGINVEAGTNQAMGNRGYIDRVTFRNVEVGPSAADGWWMQGTNITHVKWLDCYIHDCQGSGVNVYDYGGAGNITNSDWTIERCRFERNMIASTGLSGALAHFRDATQIGVNNQYFLNNYFGPADDPSNTGGNDFCLTPYAAANCRISGNLFDNCGAVISLGYSHSGQVNRPTALNRAWVTDNVFQGVRQCFDPDASQFMYLRGNIFSGVLKGPVIAPYGDHWPTVIEDNIFYDCNASDPASLNTVTRSIINAGGAAMDVRNNIFIDDRALQNPGTVYEGPGGASSVQLALGTVTGGSLGSRTVYVQYTFANATGETMASAEQSISVASGSLLTINASSAMNWPRGATAVNYYAATTSGAETLQVTIALPPPSGTGMAWTEPSTGITSGGASVPGSNTTHNLTNYAIHEGTGGAGGSHMFSMSYTGNRFYGFPSGDEIVQFNGFGYSRVTYGNITNPTCTTGGDSLMAATSTVFAPAGAYTIGPGDGTVLAGTTQTITLPTAVGIPGVKYTVKNTGTGTVTVATTSAQTIDGASTASLAAQNQAVTVLSDGANWQSLSSAGSGASVPASDTVAQRMIST